MKPIGPLMWEHRLIESMVHVITGEVKAIKTNGYADSSFVDAVVDFFRTYADRTHHGKEEDILFRELATKNLSAEHEQVMKELMIEHVTARETVGRLADANEKYRGRNPGALREIERILTALTELYPAHIEKEDKHFFYPSMEYFSNEEQDVMLREFREFDQNMIHEKYRNIVKKHGGKVLIPLE